MHQSQRLFVLAHLVRTISQTWRTWLLGSVVMGLGVIGVTLLFPLNYRATVRLLVIQRADASVDPYTSARGAEKMAQIMARVVQSDSFRDKVLASGFQVRDDFGTDTAERRQHWRQTMEARQLPDLPVLEVRVFRSDQEQARNLARAASVILQAQASEYHGLGEAVRFKEIDSVVVSRYPVKPNLLWNGVAGLALGAVLTWLWLHWRGARSAPAARGNGMVRIPIHQMLQPEEIGQPAEIEDLR